MLAVLNDKILNTSVFQSPNIFIIIPFGGDFSAIVVTISALSMPAVMLNLAKIALSILIQQLPKDKVPKLKLASAEGPIGEPQLPLPMHFKILID